MDNIGGTQGDSGGDREVKPIDEIANQGKMDLTKTQPKQNGPRPKLRRFKSGCFRRMRVGWRKAKWHDRVVALATVIIAAVGIGQVIIYHQMKKLMESSAGQTQQLIDAANIQACAATKNAAAAASFSASAGGINEHTGTAVTQFQSLAGATQKAVRQNRELFELDQRPYIALLKTDMLNAPEVGKPVKFQLTLENVGKTVGLNSFEQTRSVVAPAIEIIPPPAPDKVESGLPILPNTPFAFMVDTAPLTKEQMDSITQRKSCIYAGGYVSYHDIFGEFRQTVFCGFYKSGGPPVWSPQQTAVPFCPHNNRIIWSGTETHSDKKGAHITKCEE